MKRLFVAVKINPDPSFLEQYKNLRNNLRHEKIKWVEENNIHVTLKFLGETDETLIPAIISVLEKTASATSSFEFRLEKTGIFGSIYAPRVIWSGIEPHQEMKDLMKSVHTDLQKTGFEPDSQNLIPHLTLGRIKTINDKQLFQSILENHRNLKSELMMAAEFHLYESILKKERPVYISHKTFNLRK